MREILLSQFQSIGGPILALLILVSVIATATVIVKLFTLSRLGVGRRKVADEALKRWGFRYVTVAFTWVKTTKNGHWHMGTGYYTRANPEMCLLGIAGNMGLPKSRGVRQLIVEPVREHSRKPDSLRGDIEAMFDGPYVELFARSQREGWAAWGNETSKFMEAAE